MDKNRKVIPLFLEQEEEEKLKAWGITAEELYEVESVVSETLSALGQAAVEPREAGIGDWVMENCNALPVHQEDDGRVIVAVPIQTFDEMVCLVVDCVKDYESMKSALEKIAGRGNELERKIAKNALDNLSTNEKNDTQ